MCFLSKPYYYHHPHHDRFTFYKQNFFKTSTHRGQHDTGEQDIETVCYLAIPMGFHTWEGTLVCPEEYRFLAVQDFRCTVETSNWSEVELSSWSVAATTAGINSTVAESAMFVVKIGLVVTNCQSHTTHCEAHNKERESPMLTLKSNHILKANTTNIKKASSANGHPSLMAALVSATDLPSNSSPSSNL